MQIARRVVEGLALALAAAVLAACASTKIVSQWSEPSYAPIPFKKVLVFGISNQPALRRTFEDQFVEQLRAAGVDAQQSYLYLQNDGKADEATIRAAVEKAGADGAIVTRLVKAEQKTQVDPGFYQPAFGYGFYGGYSSAWMGGFYDPPTVYQYDVYNTETSLFDIRSDKLVWSALAETTAPGSATKESAAYVKLMIEAMKKRNLI